MKYLVISDIHSNLDALETVLEDAPAVDGVICLGDIVGYAAQPNECVERVAELPNLLCLAGNHDLGVLSRVDLNVFGELAKQPSNGRNGSLTRVSESS